MGFLGDTLGIEAIELEQEGDKFALLAPRKLSTLEIMSL